MEDFTNTKKSHNHTLMKHMGGKALLKVCLVKIISQIANFLRF